MFTLANILTISRIFIAPLFLVCVLVDTAWGMHLAVGLFVAGALTDYFDGLIARRYGQVTELGMELDPLADKVLTTTAWVALVYMDVMPLWMAVAIIIRDFGTTVLRSYASSKRKPIITSVTAKVKTMIQMVFIAYGLIAVWLTRTNVIPSMTAVAKQALASPLTFWSIFVITLFTVFTTLEYLIVNRAIFRATSKGTT